MSSTSVLDAQDHRETQNIQSQPDHDSPSEYGIMMDEAPICARGAPNNPGRASPEVRT